MQPALIQREVYNTKKCEMLKQTKALTPLFRSQFFYTITFLLIPLIFYLTEFLTLRPEYEPTGLRSRIQVGKAFCYFYELFVP